MSRSGTTRMASILMALFQFPRASLASVLSRDVHSRFPTVSSTSVGSLVNRAQYGSMVASFTSSTHKHLDHRHKLAMVSYRISLKGKPKATVEFGDRTAAEITVKQLKAAVHAKFPKVGAANGSTLRLYSPDLGQLEPNRQRLTLPKGDAKPIPLTEEGKTLASYGVTDSAELRLKDLGQQVPYRYLYLWEYVSLTIGDIDIGEANGR